MESSLQQLQQDLADLFRQTNKTPNRLRPMGGAGEQGRVTPPSPELQRAEAELKRVLANIEAGQKEMGVPVRAAKTSNPEAELKQLLAEIKARQAEWNAPSTPVAVSSK